MRFGKGEVSLWIGINGHGKSRLLSQVMLSLCAQGYKVCNASFEMKPAATLQRMARMFCGMNPFSPEFQGEAGVKALEDLFDDFGDWTDGRLWLYDQQGTVNPKTVIAVIRYCARELGVTHFVVDNLIKCVRSDEDYERVGRPPTWSDPLELQTAIDCSQSEGICENGQYTAYTCDPEWQNFKGCVGDD